MAIWTLGPECHSLRHLYCFKNTKLEAKYQSDCNHFNVWSTQVNYYATMFLGILNCVSYIGDPTENMPMGFWLNFAIALLSVCFAAASASIKRLRARALVVHFTYCIIRILIFSLAIPLQANLWFSVTTQKWLPSGTHLILEDSTGKREVADVAFTNFLKSDFSNVAIVVGYVEVVSIWMFFAMTGLNVYTLVGYVLILAIMMPCIALVPSSTPFGLSNTLCIMLISTITYLILALIVERCQRSKALVEHRLVREMRASQTADSVLNHSLKNTMADVVGHIETFCGGAAPRSTLEDALACLHRGMRICKERQVFLQLAAGEYTPMRNVVQLREFGEQLLAGRNVMGRFLDLTVHLDSALLSLILDNALSNAFKHGHPENPQVEFEIAEISPLRPDCRRVQFSVCNAANPHAEPLTPTFVDDLLSGRFLPKQEVPILSNGIGFSHALMAAKLAGVTINLQQQDGVVTFTAWMEVRDPNTLPPTEMQEAGNLSSTAELFPRGLRFFVLDDSNIARRYMQFLISSWCDPSVVQCFGAEETDIGQFLLLAPQGADVVIVDQHLEYGNTYLGTDVIGRLCSLGFQGFICIRSADDTADHQQKYLKHGAHCSFSKDMQGAQFITQLKEAFVEFLQAPAYSEAYDEGELPLGKPLSQALNPTERSGDCFTILRRTSTVYPV